MLHEVIQTTQGEIASENMTVHAAAAPEEIALELVGKGKFHFDLEDVTSQNALRIHGHLVERVSGSAEAKPVCITMSHGDAATLARKLAGTLGIAVLRVVESPN